MVSDRWFWSGSRIETDAADRYARNASAVIAASVLLFVGLEAVAVARYPGGTWWHPHARGYSFWENYLCDLVQIRAIDGASNLAGSRCAAMAMICLVVGLGALWSAAPRFFVRPARASIARGLGLASSAAILGVVATPGDRFGIWHGVLVLVAGTPGLRASALAVDELLRFERPPRAAAWTGAAWVAFALVDFGPYAVHIAARTSGTPFLPAMQKVAIACLLAWMLAVSARVRRDRYDGSAPPRSSPCPPRRGSSGGHR
jgi:hypothetical protein